MTTTHLKIIMKNQVLTIIFFVSLVALSNGARAEIDGFAEWNVAGQSVPESPTSTQVKQPRSTSPASVKSSSVKPALTDAKSGSKTEIKGNSFDLSPVVRTR